MLMDEKLLSKGRDQAKGNYAVVHNEENPPLGLFDKPLPFCGCGIGWFSFLLGFVFPVMWYFATVLYFCNYYQRDPRERSGLAASAIAAMMCTIGLAIAVLIILF